MIALYDINDDNIVVWLYEFRYRVSQKSEFYRIEHVQIGFPSCYLQAARLWKSSGAP